MHDKGIKFYRVYDAEKRQIDFHQDPESTTEEAAARLEEFLNQVEGLVHITLSLKTDKEKGEGATGKNTNLYYTLYLGGTTPGKAMSGTSTPQMTRGEIAAIIAEEVAKARQEWEKDQKIADLENQLKEAKEGDPMLNQMVTGFMGMLSQSGMMEGAVPATTALAGTADAAERQTRLTSAIRTLAKNDGNYLEHLEKVAELSEKKPLVYAGAIAKLMKY